MIAITDLSAQKEANLTFLSCTLTADPHEEREAEVRNLLDDARQQHPTVGLGPFQNNCLLRPNKMSTHRTPAHLILSLTLAFLPPLGHAQSREHIPCCGPITSAGEHLSDALDAMNVESLWLVHQHVNWETGEPDRGPDYTGPGTHTHCSAFAAAAAKKFGIYLLRPPEHGQILLANAQFDWLASDDGRQAGWRIADGMREAQRLANEGSFVLAVFQSPDAHTPGHAAIVRPSKRSMDTLLADGPELIQAGQHNHNRVNARVAFENHPGAFPDGIRYYAHSIP